jgi:hypothetical protein
MEIETVFRFASYASLNVVAMAEATPPGGTTTGERNQMRGVWDTVHATLTQEAKAVQGSREKENLIFATFAESIDQLDHAALLAESIRTFAGRYQHKPIRIFVPPEKIDVPADLSARLRDLRAELCQSASPEQALWLPYARKVFAAARAEAQAERRVEIMAWLDEDTIILKEPGAFALEPCHALAYRPVTHRNIGTLYAEPVDDFWARIYRRLEVSEEALFPMITPADGDTIRPYFNAGLLVVRPERRVLRRWAEDFALLYTDSTLVAQCRRDGPRRIFLHQAALAGAILNLVDREQMVELPWQYNYPLFFQEMYGANKAFDSIADVVTLRYDVYLHDPAPDWKRRLKGPPDKIGWLIERLEG